jgi:hypothetical protein
MGSPLASNVQTARHPSRIEAMSRKHPLVATLLSFGLAGIGHVYTGEV